MKFCKYKVIYLLEYYASKPFIITGIIISYLIKFKGKYETLLFNPNADVGGSIIVNIELIKCLNPQKTLVVFTKRPKNNGNIEMFLNLNCRIIDLSPLIDNKYIHFINLIYRGIILEWIRKAQIKNIIGGECIYFYKIIPHLKKEYNVIEICHVDKWVEYSIRFIEKINYRICSTEYLKKQIENQYRSLKINDKFFKRIKHIENCVESPKFDLIENKNSFNVYFIGRGNKQKRVHLACEIAKELNESNLNIKFTFIGDHHKIIDTSKYPTINFLKSIHDINQMKKHYQLADVLLMTSEFEGLPITIMEMMSYGKAIISTDVNSIPDYIKNGENGFLITAKEETEIIKQGKELILNLYNNQNLLNKIKENNKLISKQMFSRSIFCKNYKELIKVTSH